MIWRNNLYVYHALFASIRDAEDAIIVEAKHRGFKGGDSLIILGAPIIIVHFWTGEPQFADGGKMVSAKVEVWRISVVPAIKFRIVGACQRFVRPSRDTWR